MTPLAHLTALVTEAERAFAGQPKALWSDRTYLAPKDARVLRELIAECRREPSRRSGLGV